MIRLNICLFFLCVFFSIAQTGSGYYNWLILKDDDGTCDSIWGSCGLGQSLCKLFILDVDPAKIDSAIIRYEIGANPYHSPSKTYPGKPMEGIVWTADVEIRVNGIVVARGSPVELANKGWHKVAVDPDTLDWGDNLVTFSMVGDGKGAGCFYMGIDTGTHHWKSYWSGDGGVHGRLDTLRPGSDPDPKWQGEYIVRLMVALRDN